MPQIVLQIRILSVAESSFRIDTQTLSLSIGLAVCHLILEGGIIFLDKSAFQMHFMQYSLECLGGRVQWTPFQHLISDIVTNQLYIFHGRDQMPPDEHNFNAESYRIRAKGLVWGESDDEHTRELQKQHLSLNYEEIVTDIMKCFEYQALYEFSSESLEALIQILIICPAMKIPSEFKLFSANIPLQNLMKHVLCAAQLKLGRRSIGGVHTSTLNQLYQASIHKIQLKLQHMDDAITEYLERSLSPIGKMSVDDIPLHTLRDCFE
eukprot:231271_1